MKARAVVITQAIGLILIVAGIWMVYPPAAVAAFGIGLVVGAEGLD